ncbi:hypothetical protein JNM87_04055 [Candidatus Saccharibacteria bacterium]|nr:hypothetical protein [Candidatus Saccharibacteria bacterium]
MKISSKKSLYMLALSVGASLCALAGVILMVTRESCNIENGRCSGEQNKEITAIYLFVLAVALAAVFVSALAVVSWRKFQQKRDTLHLP